MEATIVLQPPRVMPKQPASLRVPNNVSVDNQIYSFSTRRLLSVKHNSCISPYRKHFSRSVSFSKKFVSRSTEFGTEGSSVPSSASSDDEYDEFNSSEFSSLLANGLDQNDLKFEYENSGAPQEDAFTFPPTFSSSPDYYTSAFFPSSPSTSSSPSKPGLYRTPISGGVQSATSAHRLPTPAVAVRNLVEQAKYGHLCTVMSRMHHRRRGYPFGSLVDFAVDTDGHPIFCFSPLAIHTRNILADPRCTLVVQVPGWSGLSNPRVTIFGEVFPLSREQQEAAQKLYVEKHQHGASQQWGNFYFYRMEKICDIYFVGGFGTVAWVDVTEFESSSPDTIARESIENTLRVLNERFSTELRTLLSTADQNHPCDDVAFISIDGKGVDVRVRRGVQYNMQRISFGLEDPLTVSSLEEALSTLQGVMESASSDNTGILLE